MKNCNLLLVVVVFALLGCAKKETVSDTQQAVVTVPQEVEFFRVECGLPSEEDQARKGTQAVSLTVYGNPDLSNVDTIVSDAESTFMDKRTEERKWSVYFDTNHDGDAVELSVIKSGEDVDGYRIVDRIKKSGNYGVDGRRVIEIRELASCLKNAGGKEDAASAHVLSERPEKQADGTSKIVRGDKKDLKLAGGCTCAFEMK
jgi:hypothetical protein